ncbi:putative Zinc finger, RING/FYVE/PHD-type, E3 ubiquitin ligase RBR family [Helianthus anomalus]
MFEWHSECVMYFELRLWELNVSNVHEAWFANEDKVRKVVGLLDKTDTKLPKCRELVGFALNHIQLKTRTAACGHPFCNTCWTAYISTSINYGPGCLTLRCSILSCGAAVVWTWSKS